MSLDRDIRDSAREQVIDQVLAPFKAFARIEASSGILLMACAVGAMVWANSEWSKAYFALWDTRITVAWGELALSKPLELWINDALMAVFFFMVGLEIKREILVGSLNSLRKAALPIFAAAGGMIVPALVYFMLNPSGPGSHGWGIPMATDIAFALGILSLLGDRVPVSLKVFLTAVAIVDDIGAVLVIALFYTADISMAYIVAAGVALALMALLNAWGTRYSTPYVILAAIMWFCFLKSGVHATIAGVLAAMTIPARTRVDSSVFVSKARKLVDRFEQAVAPSGARLNNREQLAALEELELAGEKASTPLQRIEHGLHPWVAFFIMPVFALCNAGVEVGGGVFSTLARPESLGIFLGLIIGKQAGVLVCAWLAVRLGVAAMPRGMGMAHFYGAGWLSGIGFTMSMFIANLAFPAHPELVETAKIGILAASLAAGAGGYLYLRFMSDTNKRQQ